MDPIDEIFSNIMNISIPERMNLTVMDLLPHEIQIIPVWGGINNTELVAGGVCHHEIPHPNNVNKGRCCIGATSAGGGQVYTQLKSGGNNCAQDAKVYELVHDLALDELDANPVKGAPYSKKNDLILKCDICQIIRVVASLKHKRIAFIGDSVQGQALIGFECELSRRGFHMSEWQNNPFLIEQPTPPNRVPWKYGIKTQKCTNVTVPSWILDHDAQRGQSLSPQVEICMYRHYRPLVDMKAHGMIAAMSDIMLIDYGLHYLYHQTVDLKEFKSTIEALLLEFKTNITDCVLIFRESTAQHFDFDGGEYQPITNSSHTCVPHENHKSLQQGPYWRRNVLQEAATSQNFSVVDAYGIPYPNSTNQISRHVMENKVTLLPFFDFTARLSYLHTNDVDCTHFYYTPHLWYPLWRHLQIAMDHNVINGNP